jgi:IS30 family transposase
MTRSKLNILIEQAAHGVSGNQIAKQIGVSPSTVSLTLNKTWIKDRVESIQAQVAEQSYAEAADNMVYAIKAYQHLDKDDDPQLREHGMKCSIEIARAIGILPSSTGGSPVVLNILNQSNITLSPAVEKLLSSLEYEPEIIED